MIRSFTAIALLGCAVAACCRDVEQGVVAPASQIVPSSVTALAASCSGCHAGGAIVSLDDWDAEQIEASLSAYRVDEAGTTVMHRLARGYSEGEVRAIAAYLGQAHGG